MTRRSFHALIAGAALPRQLLFGGDTLPILTAATEKYEALKSYYFEGKVLSQSTIKEKTTSTELGFVSAFAAPDKFRLEFDYPTAGTWLRMSDGKVLVERRSITKESTRTPADQFTPRIMRSSPIYNFERLSETAEAASHLRDETLEVAGAKFDCEVIQFTAHRHQLRPNETPGKSLVWISKDSGLVLKEEIRSTATNRGDSSENVRTTTIEKFRINQNEPDTLFTEPEGSGKKR